MPSLLQKIAVETESTGDFVKFVAKSHANQIRHMDQVEAYRQIDLLLPTIAQMYGQRAEVDDLVWKECIRLVYEKFPFLSIAELKEAYRQWSTGEIEAKGAEMYGGQFNAGQLGKILGAYADRRKRVLGAYLREKEEIKEQEDRETRKRIAQEAFDTAFPHMIANAKKTITDWREVPVFWYDAAMSRKMIEFEPGEALRIFEDAKELELIERANEQEEGMKSLADVFRQEEKNPIERAKVIARKLAVFRKLIK